MYACITQVPIMNVLLRKHIFSCITAKSGFVHASDCVSMSIKALLYRLAMAFATEFNNRNMFPCKEHTLFLWLK